MISINVSVAVTYNSAANSLHGCSELINTTLTQNDTHFLPGETEVSNSPSETVRLLGKILLGIILGSLSFITFAGNVIVIHAVRIDRKLQTVSNMFILSLASADMIVGVFVMPISAIYVLTENWLFGLTVCQIWMAADYIASTASILNLLVLSLDRYWSVTNPLKYLRRRTPRRALAMTSIVWFLSFTWLLPIVGWHIIFREGQRVVPGHVCDVEYAKNTPFKLSTALVNYYLPLLIMLALYVKIFRVIRRRSALAVRHNFRTKQQKEEPNCTLSGYTITQNMSNNNLNVPDRRKSRLEALRSRPVSDSSDQLSPTASQEDSNLIPYSLNAERKSRSRYNVYYKWSASNGLSVRQNVHREESKSLGNIPDSEHVRRWKPEHRKSSTLRWKSISYDSVFKISRVPIRTKAKSQSFRALFTKQNESNGNIVAQRRRHSFEIVLLRRVLDKKTENRPLGNARVKSDDSRNVAKSTCALRLTNNSKPTKICIPADSKAPQNSKILFIKSGNRIVSPRAAELFSNKPAAGKLTQSANRTPYNRKSCKSFRTKKNSQCQSSYSNELKAARQLGVIMSAFMLCFCPYFVCFVVVAFCSECVDSGLMTAVTWIGYLNSTLNPFLYPLCNHQFRQTFRRMLSARAGRLWKGEWRMIEGVGGVDPFGDGIEVSRMRRVDLSSSQGSTFFNQQLDFNSHM